MESCQPWLVLTSVTDMRYDSGIGSICMDLVYAVTIWRGQEFMYVGLGYEAAALFSFVSQYRATFAMSHRKASSKSGSLKQIGAGTAPGVE
jgi:hypothetical protein